MFSKAGLALETAESCVFFLPVLTGERDAGAPLVVSEDLLKSFNISVVARGTLSETCGFVDPDETRYELPKSKGIYRCVSSP